MASYTLAGWRAYAALRGNMAPTNAVDADANAALTRAFDYIRLNYILRFLTEYSEDHANVTEAVYIAASYELTKPGFWSVTYTPSQVKVLTEVKGIKWTVASGTLRGGIDSNSPMSPAIDALLNPFCSFGMPAVLVV
jgi:hypothetical protein